MKRLLLVPYLLTSLVVCTVYAFKYASLPFAWWYVITITGLVVGLAVKE